jgi:transcriptional regulator with XRE-family HTH domain
MTRIQLDIQPVPSTATRRSDARLAIATRLAAAAADAVAAAPASALPSMTPATRDTAPPPFEHEEPDMAQPPVALHELLDRLRRVARMSIGELAAAVDATDADISQVLAGQVLPGTDFLDDLLDACRATTSERAAAHELHRPEVRAEDTSARLRHPAAGLAGLPDITGRHRNRVLLSEDELRLRTPADLARVFQLALDRAGLTAGQLAIKAKISRSQVYNLKKKESTAVPRNPEQITAYLAACGVPPQQVGIVLKQWQRLDVLRRQGKTPELPGEPPPRSHTRHEIIRPRLTPAPPTNTADNRTTTPHRGDGLAAPSIQQPSSAQKALPAETTNCDLDVPGYYPPNRRARHGLIGWFHDTEDDPGTSRLPGSAFVAGLADVLVKEYGIKRLLRLLLLVLLVIALVVVLLNVGTNSLVAHFGTLFLR